MTTATRVRLRFAKRGDLRLVSHHDLLRCLERTLRRAEVPVAKTQGFNPRPKIVFTLALGLGIEGRREVVELDLAEPMEPAEVLRRLTAAAPPGFDWLEAESVPTGRPAHAAAVHYTLDVPAERRDAARASLERFLASTAWPYTRHRPDRTVAVDLRPFVLDAAIDAAGGLWFRMQITPTGSARPEELIDALGLRDLLGQGAVLARTEMELVPLTEPSRASSAD
jgi:radical SAM-linked protein